MQRYRSGHNGADSKSVWEQSHEGSNPSRCAKWNPRIRDGYGDFCFIYAVFWSQLFRACPRSIGLTLYFTLYNYFYPFAASPS